MNDRLFAPFFIALALLVGIFIGRASLGSKSSAIEHFAGQDGCKIEALMGLIDNFYVDSVDVDSLMEEAIPKILEKLDPHTVYIPAKDLDDVKGELKSNFGGIGVQFTIREDTVNVVQVIQGGPSAHLGVQPGDKIIKVNGHVMCGKQFNKGRGVSNQMVMDSLRGEYGTKVSITVLRDEGEEIDFDIVRGLIPMHSVQASYMINDTLGYMIIDRFAERTYEEMIQGLAKLKMQGCRHLIVDLRSNQGGLLDVVIRMCNEFLERGDMIVYTEGIHQPRQNAIADGTGVCKNMGVTVLIDEFSASASEIFAGAMQDNDRGTIVGRRSFGKGLVQTQLEMRDMSGLRLTIARYYTPSGRCIQRPYDDGKDEYYQEMSRRYTSGEVYNEDSSAVDKSKVFYTKKGRKVYGGGGIMPDVFVARDSTSATKTLYTLRRRGLIYNFALDYTAKNRKMFEGCKDVYAKANEMDVLTPLAAYAQKKGVDCRGLAVAERPVVDREVKAYIVRNLGYENLFYKFIYQDDEMIFRAMNPQKK